MQPPHPHLTSHGNAALADLPKTAFFCSRAYPARAVLRIYDWARETRDAGECVVSGFHSRLEGEVLDILLRGRQPIILAAARALPKRYPARIKTAVEAGRLLVLSPFAPDITRITASTARRRNAFMLDIAEKVVVGYASPDGGIAKLMRSAPAEKNIRYLSE